MTAGERPTTAPAADDTGPRPARRGETRLEAPHRRGGSAPRIVERLGVIVFKTTSWLLAVVPAGIARPVIGRLSQLGYLLWPTKRHWSDRNFAQVLGLEPSDPRVRKMALRAYYGYGRYLVELMRLPSRPQAELLALVPALDSVEVMRLWREAPNGGGLIFAVAHMGNNEAVAASIAHHGMPINVLADDSAFPEIYEILRRQREGWGVHIIAWRNIREIFSVLRRKEMLGLLIDWGYRDDGIPVQLFGAWTTLPAGPATLAAKTGSRILPIAIHRQPDDTFVVSWPEPIDVASGDPAELQRATQAIADALAANVGTAPDQWYSFKPMWPATAAEAGDLAHRAAVMQAGTPDPGPR